MAINLRSFIGGGEYIPRQYFLNQSQFYQSIPNAPFDALTLEAPAGLRVRLEELYSSSQDDIHSIILDDTFTLLGNTVLANFQNTTQGFYVIQNEANSRDYGDFKLKDVVANKIVIRYLSSGNPTITYRYSYSYGL